MNIALLILRFLPVVLQTVVAIENAVGSSVPGTTKKQLVLNSLQVAAQVGEKTDDRSTAVVSALVDNVVGSLNQSGVFTKAAAPAITIK